MPTVNNAFYSDLGDRWYEGGDHPIALLRAETPLKLSFVRERLAAHGIGDGARILDVACGAGLVSFPLAEAGYTVRGVDLAEGAIETARAQGGQASFEVGDAYALRDGDASQDAVLLLDVLEHVERPADVLAEAARVVRPGGLVLFNTFNTTPLARLLAVHGFALVTRGGPEHIHVYDLFIAPRDLRAMASRAGLDVEEVRGVRPALGWPLWWSVLNRRVHPDFAFRFSASTAVGYVGCAVRRTECSSPGGP